MSVFGDAFADFAAVCHSFAQRARDAGVVFPTWDGAAERWYVGSAVYEPGAASCYEQTWRHRPELLADAALHAALARLGDNLARLQATDDGLDLYFAEMAHATAVVDARLFQASRDGAVSFSASALPVLRVCLENIDGLTPDQQATFHRSVHVPLDDGSPIADQPPMSPDEFARFFAALDDAVDWLTSGRSVLVHCSQGQSRSGLFTTCLLIKLARLGLLPGPAPSTIADAIDMLAAKRRILDYAPRWHPFLVYFNQHHCS